MLSRSKVAFGRSQMQASVPSVLHEYFYNITARILFLFFFLRKIYMHIYINNNDPLEQIRNLNKYNKNSKKNRSTGQMHKKRIRRQVCFNSFDALVVIVGIDESKLRRTIAEPRSIQPWHAAASPLYNRILLISPPSLYRYVRHGSLKLYTSMEFSRKTRTRTIEGMRCAHAGKIGAAGKRTNPTPTPARRRGR